jgi:hypothetical protein
MNSFLWDKEWEIYLYTIKPLLLSIFDKYPQVYENIYGGNWLYNSEHWYLIVEDTTHYLRELYENWYIEPIKWILSIFSEILNTNDVWRDHIFCAFCEVIWNYPEVLHWILPLMSQELRNETIVTNQEILRNSSSPLTHLGTLKR